MSDKKTGGFAFPLELDRTPQRGMTLRDWFAGQALVKILNTASFEQGESSLAIDVARAYRVADAMIAEREK